MKKFVNSSESFLNNSDGKLRHDTVLIKSWEHNGVAGRERCKENRKNKNNSTN